MNRKNIRPKRLAAALLAAGLVGGVAGNAQAGAYAVSYDNIDNFSIQADPEFINFNLPAIPNSSASAVLNGSGTATGGAGLSDAPIAIAPGSSVAPANNSFTPVGMPAGGEYAYGDAQIQQQIVNPTDTLRAVNIAEGMLSSEGNGTASGQNSSSTTFTTIKFEVTTPGSRVFFEGIADPYIKVLLNPDALAGSQAQGILTANVNIKADNVTGIISGTTVFNWAPNGIVAPIIGGTETLDDATLNTVITQLVPGQSTYDPTNDASFGGGAVGAGGGGICGAFCNYAAFTDPLGVGLYTLSISASETININKVVPEPATLLLLGGGLFGLVAANVRRRRRAV